VRAATFGLIGVLSGALSACGSASDSGFGSAGVGGANAAQTATATTGTGTGTSGRGGAGGGAAQGGDGGGSEAECLQKCIKADPAGAEIYKPLVICVFCNECYVDCNGAATADANGKAICTEPGMGTTCDNSGNCGMCKDCALEANCLEQSKACKADQACIDYANCIATCAQK